MSPQPSRSHGNFRPRHNRRAPQQARQHSAAAPSRVERKPSPNAIQVSELESVFTQVDEVLQRALADMGFRTPTPIQEQSIPDLLAGKDMIGIAQTGTGKTAAFGLPLLQRLFREKTPARSQRPKALILAPTRELAAQIDDTLQSCSRFTQLRHACIFGGVGQGPQVSALRRGVDVLVATPGRLLDLMSQRELFLDDVEVFVLDEADRMLDMGFLPDIKRVMASLPKKRQSLLFSATMPDAIRQLSNTILFQPVYISIEPEKPTIEAIVQHVRFVDKASKIKALKDILECDSMHRVIVFTRMKHVANRVAEGLGSTGMSAVAIHGNKSQAARTRALDGFRAGKVRVLVATDIAARGIDVPNVSHVVNFDLPEEAETYVHRIGRTARAGAEGHAVSFCAADERGYLAGIERLIRKEIPVQTDHKFHSDSAQRATGSAAKPAPRGGGGRSGGNGGGHRSGGPSTGRNGRPARRSGVVRSRRIGARAS